MGYESHFVKATGDCRIMAIPFKKAIEDYKKRHNIDYNDTIDPYGLLSDSSRKQVDEISGEEYYPLKRFGHLIHYQTFYGYFWGQITYALHTMYESMSIDHASCYESEMKYELTKEEKEKLRMTFNDDNGEGDIVKGKLDICGSFETIEDFKLFFKDFLINNEEENNKKGFVKPSIENQIFSDIDIVTQSDYLENDECNSKTRRYNTEPCTLYFTSEDLEYLYLEFLPFGKGIKLAISHPLGSAEIDEIIDDYSDYKFLGDVRDEAFHWRVKDLDCKKKNYFMKE